MLTHSSLARSNFSWYSSNSFLNFNFSSSGNCSVPATGYYTHTHQPTHVHGMTHTLCCNGRSLFQVYLVFSQLPVWVSFSTYSKSAVTSWRYFPYLQQVRLGPVKVSPRHDWSVMNYNYFVNLSKSFIVCQHLNSSHSSSIKSPTLSCEWLLNGSTVVYVVHSRLLLNWPILSTLSTLQQISCSSSEENLCWLLLQYCFGRMSFPMSHHQHQLVSVLWHFQHKQAITCHRSRKCIT